MLSGGFSIYWLISACIALPGSIYALIQLRALTRQHQQPNSSRIVNMLIPVGFIAMLIFSGIGFYGTQQLERQLVEAKAIEAWGSNSAIVNTEVLSQYKSSYKAMLIFRLDVRSVDYLTDREIVKSYLFDIDGTHRATDVSLNDAFWSRSPSSTGRIQVYLVVLPKAVPADRITCLDDVEAHKGNIITHRESKAVLLLKTTNKK